MPAKPARAENEAPNKNPKPVLNPNNIQSRTNKITATIPTVLYCLFKKAMAPSLMYLEIATIFPEPEGADLMRCARKTVKTKANTETIMGI